MRAMNFPVEKTLQQAATLIKLGRLAEALSACESSLAEGPDPVVKAMAGALSLRLGEPNDAVLHLRPVLQSNPDDRTVRANLADALIALQRTDEAFEICTEGHALADPSLRLMRLRGHLAQIQANYETASEAYRYVVDRAPDDWISWNNFGNALTALKRYPESAIALGRAATLMPNSAPVQLNFAGALSDDGQFEAAEQHLRETAARFSNDANPPLSLYALLKRLGREDDAFDALKEALQREPLNADILSDFAHESSVRTEFDQAEAACEKALSVNPGLSQPYISLASLFERTNREQLFDGIYDRAVAAGASEETLSYIRVLRYKRAGEIEKAWSALQQVGGAIVPARRKQLEGQLQDRRGNFDASFDAFAEANAAWSLDASQPVVRAEAYRQMVEETTGALSASWLSTWAPVDLPLDRSDPAFLVGFPRSGTTLLDTMLMGHSKVQVLEEEPYLTEVETEIGRLYALPQLSASAIGSARHSYFNKIAADHPLRDDSIVIDKHPLHLNKAVTIHRLFPKSKFILALRHPCDVLLSCFTTSFRLNNAMANFLEMRTAAELYDLTFAHWEKAQTILDLPFKVVVYERLVEHQERELRPLFEWLGLDLEDAVLDHQSTAVGRGHIKTASYAQVVEPIYRRSSGRWRRYEKHLEPIFPIIESWVVKFGYSLDDDRIPAWPDPA